MSPLQNLAHFFAVVTAIATLPALSLHAATATVTITGEIVDAATGQPVAARLYLRNAVGDWFFADSLSAEGTAIRYAKINRLNPKSQEHHTTLSAHPFRAELPPGPYTVTVERGKEYFPLEISLTVPAATAVPVTPAPLRLELTRWVDMATHRWFSGDGHVHRSLAELPTLMLAEDLNVALPQTYWAIQAFTPPNQSPKNGTQAIPAQLIRVDATHVIWPRNTEYEIYRFGAATHNLGGVFILNHQEFFTQGAPPMRPIAEAAHRQGALLDMDKHDWTWSLMIVPVMKIDLFELANNHLWRTEFGITSFHQPAPSYMNLPNRGESGDERDWINYGFESYYTFLNCGFRLRPTAGSASGVHPVPLGFGRVYVHCADGFSYDAWIKGLGAGRSFVTTGPMLLAKINGDVPGGVFPLRTGETARVPVAGTLLSEHPVPTLEVLVNGEVAARLTAIPRQTPAGAWQTEFSGQVDVSGTSWVAVRCWEDRAGGRVRFAHTAPAWFEVPGADIAPRRSEIASVIERLQQQIERNQKILPAPALEEYREALATYEAIARRAR